MFDTTNAESFHHTTGSYNGGVEVWLSNLKCSSYMHEHMVKFLIGLHRNNGRREVTYEEAQSFALENGLTYVEVDPMDHSQTNYVVKLCFEKVVERINSGYYGEHVPPRFWDRYGIKILGSKELADNGPIKGKKVTSTGYDSPDEEGDGNRWYKMFRLVTILTTFAMVFRWCRSKLYYIFDCFTSIPHGIINII